MNDLQGSVPEQADFKAEGRHFSIIPSRQRSFWIRWRKVLPILAAMPLFLLFPAFLRPPLVQGPLWTGMVKVGDLNLGVSGIGKLAPVDLVTLSAAAGGTVEAVQAQVGAKLSKGDPIISLHSPEIRQLFATAERNYADKLADQARLKSDFYMRKADLVSQMGNAQDAHKIADMELTASTRLSQEGLISQIQLARLQNVVASTQRQFEQARANFHTLEAEEQVRAAAMERAVHLSQADLAYAGERVQALTLSAPEAGVLLDLPDTLTPGAPVTAGMVLAKLSAHPALGAELTIPASQAPHLTPGLPVEVYAENRLLRGNLLRVTPLAQRDQVKVYVSLEAAGTDGFLPGQAVTAEIITGHAKRAIYIEKPAQAVENTNGSIYEVDHARGLLYRRDVRFGASTGRFLLIESGLSPGREVVLGDLSQYFQHRTLRFNP